MYYKLFPRCTQVSPSLGVLAPCRGEMMMGSHQDLFLPSCWVALRYPFFLLVFFFANIMQKGHTGVALMLLVCSVLEVGTSTDLQDGEGLAGLRFPLLSSPRFPFSPPHTFLQTYLAEYVASQLCAGQPSAPGSGSGYLNGQWWHVSGRQCT